MYNPFEAVEEQSQANKALAAVAASRRFKPLSCFAFSL